MYKLLIFLLFVYLFFRIFTRYLLPWFLKYYINRTMKKHYGPAWKDMQDKTRSGTTEININPKRKTPFPNQKDDGEYVDYTEIK